jgi:hypothetical protein
MHHVSQFSGLARVEDKSSWEVLPISIGQPLGIAGILPGLRTVCLQLLVGLWTVVDANGRVCCVVSLLAERTLA